MSYPVDASRDTTFDAIRQEARATMDAAIADLQAIASEVDAETLFIHLVLALGMGPIDTRRESVHGTVPAKMEHLAYYLLPYFGVSTGKVTAAHIDRAIQAIETAFEAFMREQTFEPITGSDADLIVRGFKMDATVVRGSAYPEQTLSEIVEIQGRFEPWFVDRLGIGPTRASAFLAPIVRRAEARANEWRHLVQSIFHKGEQVWKEIRRRRRKGLLGDEAAFLDMYRTAKSAGIAAYVKVVPDIPPDSVPVSYDELDIEPRPTIGEWEALIRLIGCTPQDRSAMSSPTDISRRPVFVLSQNRVLVFDISSALDQLWHAFDAVAKSDDVFYTGRYSKWKGQWLERRAADSLTRLFPASHVYRNLIYPTPDGGTTELDIAVHWPPFVIVCEAKAVQFRLTSQYGDIGRLSTDLKRNVEEAFDQARRAARYIKGNHEATFTEKDTGRRLVIKRDEVLKTYLVTVSLHHLSFVVTRLAALQALGLFKDGEYPYAVSIADLDVITEFCPGPDVFLHYLDRRIALEKSSIQVQGDELSLFGAYLKGRLHPDRLGFNEPTERRPNLVSVMGFAEPFDFIMEYRRGDRTEEPVIELEIPTEIKEILRELRLRRQDAEARWIAFWLLDLTDAELHGLARMCREIRHQFAGPGKLCRNTIAFNDLAISVLASHDVPVDVLREATLRRTLIEKYRRKVNRAIGFGIHLPDRLRSFDTAILCHSDWSHDPAMEALIQEDVHSLPIPGSKLPGVNAPCPCGSKQKFKKCCLKRIQDARTLGRAGP